MFRGFDPSSRQPVIPRQRGLATILAVASYLLAGGYGVWSTQGEDEVEVALEPEIKDFAVEEEPEPEPEIEEEDLPPPPPEAPPPKPRKKPKPKPRPIVPDKLPDGPPPEADTAREDKSYGTGAGTGTGQRTGKPKPKATPKPKQKPKPETKKKKTVIDPEKPIKRPEGASVPKPNPNNKAPTYPSALQSQGIEGEVVLKLHVHRDGKVRGAKILRVTTTATGEEAQKKAKLLLKKAAIAAIKTWTYTPSKLGKQTISVWIIVNMPFRLRAG